MSAAVVVDTNILVRAFLSGKKDQDEILKRATGGERYLVYGAKQLEELVEVLGYERIKRKYPIVREEINKLGEWLLSKKEIEAREVSLCRDPDDNYVIGLAMRAAKNKRAYLVTSDKDILILKGKVEGVDIVKPGEFLKTT